MQNISWTNLGTKTSISPTKNRGTIAFRVMCFLYRSIISHL